MSDYSEDFTSILHRTAGTFNRLTKPYHLKGVPDFSIKLATSRIYKHTRKQLKEASKRPQRTMQQSFLTNDTTGNRLRTTESPVRLNASPPTHNPVGL